MKDTLKLVLLFVIMVNVSVQTGILIANNENNRKAVVVATSMQNESKAEIVEVHQKVWTEFPGMGGSYVYVVSNSVGNYEAVNLAFDLGKERFLQRVQTRGGVQYAPLIRASF